MSDILCIKIEHKLEDVNFKKVITYEHEFNSELSIMSKQNK